ncbi:MAG: acyl-CoA thioesterase [Ignavibacteriae bacterium]|nr:acyl-CoA thioesterase [Ignavibacteriota bacterium]
MIDRTKFKHRAQIKVRNYEIDSQGIVHNANFLLYFEVGRVAYAENLGIKVDINTNQHESRVVVVRNEIDYRSPARFGEVIDIYTRISFIRNTSFAFEAFLQEHDSKRLIAENVSIHVWLDQHLHQPRPVPDDFRNLVQKYEGDNVLITWPSYNA